MKRRFPFLFLGLLACLLPGCTDPMQEFLKGWINDKYEGAANLTDFRFGYWHKTKNGGLMSKPQDEYVTFMDEKQLQDERLSGFGADMGVDMSSLGSEQYNLLEYTPAGAEISEDEGKKYDLEPGSYAYYKFLPEFVPENANVLNYTVEEYGDKPILNFLEIGKRRSNVLIVPKELGYTGLEVSVNGNKTVTHRYPVKVQATVDLPVIVTRFWRKDLNLGPLSASIPPSKNTKIRFRVDAVPDCVKDMVFLVTDSVKIYARCIYETRELDGVALKKGEYPYIIEKRDTISLPTHTRYHRFKKGQKVVMRDLSKEIHKITARYETGYTDWRWIVVPGLLIHPFYLFTHLPPPHHIMKDEDGGLHDFMAIKHHWYIENIVFYFNIFTDNEFIKFKVYAKKDGTGDQLKLVEDFLLEEWNYEEELDEYDLIYADNTEGESGTDTIIYVAKKEESNDDIESTEPLDEMEDVPGDPFSEASQLDPTKECDPRTPFLIRFNDFMTKAQKDSMVNVINEKKREVGYDSKISEKAKDDKIDMMNQKYKDKEKEWKDDDFDGEHSE